MKKCKECKRCARYNECVADGICCSYMSVDDNEDRYYNSYVELERKRFYNEYQAYVSETDIIFKDELI